MKCENIFCIYQENSLCNNENEPDIDWRGFCKNMIPVRVTQHALGTEKMITQFKMKDGKHYFDKDLGIVTMTDEALAFFDSELDLE